MSSLPELHHAGIAPFPVVLAGAKKCFVERRPPSQVVQAEMIDELKIKFPLVIVAALFHLIDSPTTSNRGIAIFYPGRKHEACHKNSLRGHPEPNSNCSWPTLSDRCPTTLVGNLSKGSTDLMDPFGSDQCGKTPGLSTGNSWGRVCFGGAVLVWHCNNHSDFSFASWNCTRRAAVRRFWSTPDTIVRSHGRAK